jgi:hypothetical protein
VTAKPISGVTSLGSSPRRLHAWSLGSRARAGTGRRGTWWGGTWR